MRRAAGFGVLSLAATYVFFLEYLPPFKRVQLPFDIAGYHYPLLSYTFQSLRAGRLPLWDAAIYCGMPLAGNPQAALFYPPNWLLFLVRARYGGLTYKSVEVFAFLHVWLAFVLAYFWLRAPGRRRAGALCGAAVVAFSGYMLSQITHLGVATGYAWFPLALWGIDRARGSGKVCPLWMTALASALVFLAGYPATWVALCICATAYAGARGGRWMLATWGALAWSAGLAAVQACPAVEAAALKIEEHVYGAGLWMGARTYLTFFIPGFFDSSAPQGSGVSFDGECFYLGAPALFAMGWLAWRRKWRAAIPGVAIAGACLLVIVDPFGGLKRLMDATWPALRDGVREYNLLAGITMAGGILAAAGIDEFLAEGRRVGVCAWQRWLVAALTAGWCARQFWIWAPGGPEFATGWKAALEPTVTLALFAAGLVVLRREACPAAIAAALALVVFTDYKVSGTTRRFNTEAGNRDRANRVLKDARIGGDEMPGFDQRVYREIRDQAGARVVLLDGLHATELRFYGLSSPQGFDPMMPLRYHNKVLRYAEFESPRIFYPDPANERFLKDFGVRYVICRSDTGTSAKLAKIPWLRRMGTREEFFVAYEYASAAPAYRWAGEAKVIEWEPERRSFWVTSGAGGTFALLEQNFPGWRAAVDEQEKPIRLWEEAFQAIEVGPGAHRVVFEYRPRSLRIGVAISVVSALALIAAVVLPGVFRARWG